MLSRADNDLITQVGPGTPMGDAMRRYWMPALLTEELPEPDGAPVRVRLLGEDLVAWRNTDGSVGLMQNACPHRGASMFFGRNEEQGLRCVYHGWKFDVSGACIDMPNEPAESNFKHKIRATAYPCVEKASIVWCYMGPPDTQPALPSYEWMRLPEGHMFMSKTFEDCNYLQGIEGGVDSSHSSFLHRNLTNTDPSLGINGYRARSTAPRLEVVYRDYGYTYASIRYVKDEDVNYVRAYQFVLPFQQQRAGYIGSARTNTRPGVQGHLWVPIDDTSHWVFNFMYASDGGPLDWADCLKQEHQTGRGPEDYIPGTYKLFQNASNDYLIDRQAQKTKSYTGIPGTNTQDVAIQETMGAIYDRTKEHLGTSDSAVIATRRMLLQAVRDVQAGRAPAGSQGEADGVRAVEMVLPTSATWTEALKDELVAVY